MAELNVDLDDYEVPFKGIVEQSIAGIYILQDGRFRYVNETFARMCGLRREKLLGARLCDVANPLQRNALMAQYERQIRGVGASERFVIRRTSSRNPGCFEIHGTRVIFHGRPAIVGLSVDTTERERQRAELVEASERLHELFASANNVRENERHRVARELHDVIGGMLTAIKFDLSRLSRGIEALDRCRAPRTREGGTAGPGLASLALTAAKTSSSRRRASKPCASFPKDFALAPSTTWACKTRCASTSAASSAATASPRALAPRAPREIWTTTVRSAFTGSSRKRSPMSQDIPKLPKLP
ncbi:PAS domain S-box protein [Paraburkholderia sp. RL18-085-BIA-A]|uniref:PAS domain S-box protein n=1 Tax=Paraburkholderia sp. RL18-085-BIA-A TaxID=3031633 RepID=UPI0038BB395F